MGSQSSKPYDLDQELLNRKARIAYRNYMMYRHIPYTKNAIEDYILDLEFSSTCYSKKLEIIKKLENISLELYRGYNYASNLIPGTSLYESTSANWITVDRYVNKYKHVCLLENFSKISAENTVIPPPEYIS